MRVKTPWLLASIVAFAIASRGLSSLAAPVLVSDGTQNYLVADNGIVAAGGTAVTTDPVDTNTDHYAEPGQFGGQDVDQPDSWNGDRRWGNDGTDTEATWTFTDLESGTYNVYASWRNVPQANVSTAHFSISDSGPTADIDMSTGTTAISALNLNDGSRDIDFALIGSVTVSDGDLVVSVDDSVTGLDADTFIFSDAVAIGPIPIPEPSGIVLGLLGLLGLVKRGRRS
jgi:hypothetical protein